MLPVFPANLSFTSDAALRGITAAWRYHTTGAKEPCTGAAPGLHPRLPKGSHTECRRGVKGACQRLNLRQVRVRTKSGMLADCREKIVRPRRRIKATDGSDSDLSPRPEYERQSVEI